MQKPSLLPALSPASFVTIATSIIASSFRHHCCQHHCQQLPSSSPQNNNSHPSNKQPAVQHQFSFQGHFLFILAALA
eukprot:3511522-Ditylum_brightwellii.AAC.1